MSKQNEYDIVIVGGGVVGLTAACRLSQHYSRIALLECADQVADWQTESPYDLRVSAVNQASVNSFAEIGVWDSIQTMRVFPYQRMSVWDSHYSGELSFDARETTQEQLGYIIENSVLQTALSNHLLDTKVNVLYGTQLRGLHAFSDNIVLDTEQGDRLSTKLLLAADGKNSTVREWLQIPISSTPYEQFGLVALCRTELPLQQTAWQCFTEHGPLAMLPLTSNLCSLVWSVPTERAQQLIELTPEEFARELTRYLCSRLGQITLASDLAQFPLQGMQADRYIASRSALIGDAAHVVHPLAGQGLNLGIADVECLTRLLINSKRSLGSEYILRQYERERRFENVVMQKSFELIDQVFKNRYSMIGIGRSLGLKMVDKMSPVKLAFMEKAMGVPV